MRSKKGLSVCLLPVILGLFSLQAQNATSYFQEGRLRYSDHIYQPGILTVQFHPEQDDLAMPIIKLNSGERLRLSFDDLYEDYANYSYKVVHCNQDWKPSGLMTSDYLANFQNYDIQNFEYSVNALIPYTHYWLTLPNENVRMTKSGNYLLIVYRDDDEDDLVLTRRFMVYEDKVSISANIRRPTAVKLQNTHQEIDFTINHSNYEIPNPYRDLHVHLMQNQRWDNPITDLQPRFLNQGQLVYQYDEENTFPGTNEFRFFDLKSLRSLGQNVRQLDRDSVVTAYLKTHQSRAGGEYAVLFDVNGQYRVRRLGASNSATEADYVYVDFILQKAQPFTNSDVYIFGKLSDWDVQRRFRLDYDSDRNAYRTQVLLKQGFYNFMYALKPDGGDDIELRALEGSYWETENTYQILAYYRDIGSRYDRLIGYGQFSSDDLYSQ